MSKLIQLRQRIKAIETIKKIAHAMRLISMSTHSHLKNQQPPLDAYMHELERLFAQLASNAPNWQNAVLHPDAQTSTKQLLVIVGSQKGLCGSFNTHLFGLIQRFMDKNNIKPSELDIIPVGQKAVDFTKGLKGHTIQQSYDKIAIAKIENISHEIAHLIMHASPSYSQVHIASNLFKSFFAQKPQIKLLIPANQESTGEKKENSDLLWDQPATEILDSFLPQYLSGQIYNLLFQSLFAEHAARFISMDGATRNADSLLEATKLEYNKLRQAKITKELTELSSSYA